MDITSEELLQSYKFNDILKESVSIAKLSPKTFYLLTVTIIFPLSFAILVHSLFTPALLVLLSSSPSTSPSVSKHEITQLSTAAIVFTVASLYTSKPVCFASTMSAIPKVLKRLFITFIWVAALIFAYHLVSFSCMALIEVADDIDGGVLMFLYVCVVGMYTYVHLYSSALWHLASVVSVLEPVYGLAAMKKSYELLKGRTDTAVCLVSCHFVVSGVTSLIFGEVVVYGGGDYGAFTRVVVGALLVVILVIVNLVGLIVQSVFYYVCKSYHHQGIDKNILYNQLGGYLGEYVPLKSDIQMENFDA